MERTRFSEDGAVFLFAGTESSVGVALALVDVARRSVYDRSFLPSTAPGDVDDDEEPTVAGWGFGPDPTRFWYMWEADAAQGYHVGVHVNVSTTFAREQTYTADSLAALFSPCGDAIAYVVANEQIGGKWTTQRLMVATRVDGSWTETMLVGDPVSTPSDDAGQPTPQIFGWPAWSNDGARLAWFQGDAGAAPALWVRGANGSAPLMIADMPVSEMGQLGAPAWLPDDSRIVVPNVPESELQFLLVDPDGVRLPLVLEHQGGTVDWQGVAP